MRQRLWTPARSRDALSQTEKAAITAACQRLIDQVLKPRFLPVIRPTEFNYAVDICGKWLGTRYRFIQRYSGGDQYELVVRNGSWLARLVPDDNHVGYCAELHQALEEALGPGSVQVSALVEKEPALAGD